MENGGQQQHNTTKAIPRRLRFADAALKIQSYIINKILLCKINHFDKKALCLFSDGLCYERIKRCTRVSSAKYKFNKPYNFNNRWKYKIKTIFFSIDMGIIDKSNHFMEFPFLRKMLNMFNVCKNLSILNQ